MNKQLTPAMMTNGELYEEYKTGDKATQYAMLAEMAKRISRKMITPDVLPIFKQYKLNGAAHQRW